MMDSSSLINGQSLANNPSLIKDQSLIKKKYLISIVNEVTDKQLVTETTNQWCTIRHCKQPVNNQGPVINKQPFSDKRPVTDKQAVTNTQPVTDDRTRTVQPLFCHSRDKCLGSHRYLRSAFLFALLQALPVSKNNTLYVRTSSTQQLQHMIALLHAKGTCIVTPVQVIVSTTSIINDFSDPLLLQLINYSSVPCPSRTR